jgi:hypothetical protein
MNVAIDFDGTIVEHEYPEIGRPVPGAIEWIKRFQEAGAKIILWTMRCDRPDCGPMLTQAVEYLRSNGITLYGVNGNPDQWHWTSSPKAYAHIYVDDAAACCPLQENSRAGGRPYVDWSTVGPAVMKRLGLNPQPPAPR